jgi:hypothetical protein
VGRKQRKSLYNLLPYTLVAFMRTQGAVATLRIGYASHLAPFTNEHIPWDDSPGAG